jgi:hypothetical protein
MLRIRTHVAPYPFKPNPKPEPDPKLANRRPWSDIDDATITKLYGDNSWAVIGDLLGRSRQAVKMRARRLGLLDGDAK